MPITCLYTLNKKQTSFLQCPGLGSIPAFSGKDQYVNDPAATAVAKKGPIPAGTYYIIDRQTGGRFPELEDAIHDVITNTHRREWFSLYSTTPPFGDYMNVKGVLRGNFRIHPVGRLGESDGCITLTHPTQFEQLRTFLHSQKTEKIPGTELIYYGKVIVQ